MHVSSRISLPGVLLTVGCALSISLGCAERYTPPLLTREASLLRKNIETRRLEQGAVVALPRDNADRIQHELELALPMETSGSGGSSVTVKVTEKGGSAGRPTYSISAIGDFGSPSFQRARAGYVQAYVDYAQQLRLQFKSDPVFVLSLTQIGGSLIRRVTLH